MLHYVVETPRENSCSYVAERLYPVEPGIFVREFTLFYGERLTWFITEVQEDGTELATPDRSYLEENEEKLVTGTKYADITKWQEYYLNGIFRSWKRRCGSTPERIFWWRHFFFPEIRS